MSSVSVRLVNSGGGEVPSSWEVTPPVTDAALQALPAGLVVAQIFTPLSLGDHERLGAWTTSHGAVELRVYGGVRDLEFLRFYPTLHGLRVDGVQPADAGGLRYLPDGLRSLKLEFRVPRGTDLDQLARFTHLERLHLAHNRRLPPVVNSLHSLRHLAVVGPVDTLGRLDGLTHLTHLSLTSVTLPDLAALRDLPALTDLDLCLGGTTNLTDLPYLPRLRQLACERVRNLRDVTPVGQISTLETLSLGPLAGVTAVPDLSGAPALRNLMLRLGNLTDLSGLLSAPNPLQELIVVAKGPADLNDLVVLKPLRPNDFYLNLDTKTRTLTARDILQIPGTYCDYTYP
jgi:hypothetical protein